jgi:hypothetical protein
LLDLSRRHSTQKAESELPSSGLPESQTVSGDCSRPVGVNLYLSRVVLSELCERVEQDLDAFAVLDASD